jgi:hypothetical protein
MQDDPKKKDWLVTVVPWISLFIIIAACAIGATAVWMGTQARPHPTKQSIEQ